MNLKYICCTCIALLCMLAVGLANDGKDKRNSHNSGGWAGPHCWDQAGNHLLDPFCNFGVPSCTDAPEVEHSSHSKYYNKTVGAKVYYTCNDGYMLMGPEEVICQKGTQDYPTWSEQPRCVPVICPEVKEIVNGYHDAVTSTALGTVVQYYCYFGYEFKDTNRTTCKLTDSNAAANWTEPIPECTEIKCVQPHIDNAHIVKPEPQSNTTSAPSTAQVFTTQQPDSATPGNTAKVESNPTVQTTITEVPFTTTTEVPIDNSTLTNETDSGNNTTPVDQTGSVDNTTSVDQTGSIDNTTSVDQPGSINSTNTTNVTDTDNTSSSNDTAVQLPTAEDDPVDLVDPVDPVVTETVLNYYVNDTAVFKCNDGYAFAETYLLASSAGTNVHEMICKLNATGSSGSATYWTPPNKCLIDCGPVPELLCANHTTPDNTLEGAKVTYAAFPDSDLIGSSEIVCLKSGNWSEVPTCLTGCGPAPEIEHGSHSQTYDRKINSEVNYVCNDGYFITGAEVIKCVARTEPPYSQWTTPPNCSKSCDPLPNVDNGGHTDPTSLIPGANVTYFCGKNFTLVGPENVTCLSNGSWSELPFCKEMCIAPPLIANSIPSIYTYNETAFVKLTCETRYTLVGNETLECIHGYWSTPFPYCKCEVKPVDIVFIIDGSGSLGYRGFNQTLQFVINMIDRFPEETSRFGLVVFGSDVFLQFHLNQYINDTERLKERIASTQYPMGGTHTHAALNFTRLEMFQEKNGMRPNVSHTAIVVTDGRSDEFNATVQQAKLLRDAGVIIYTVGVGLLDQNELHLIASNDSYVFHVNNYESIDEIEGPLAGVTCSSTHIAAGAADEDLLQG